MKETLISVFLFFILIGCDEIGEGVVDPSDVDFVVKDVTAPTEVKYSDEDTQVFTTITFSNTESIKRVWINISSQDGVIEIVRNTEMISPYKNDDKTFAVAVKMRVDDPSIMYTIEYYISTGMQEEKKVASHDFEYNNMQENIAPVISNPLFYYENESPTLRDTLVNNKPFIFSIEVYDENGLNDIDSVYTDFYSPGFSPARVLMFDDGDEAHGDLVAGDGIYSFKNLFQNAQGERKFEFRARDREGALSNMITHIVVVK
ncbi:hypothetical protein MNBD_IGNAVI01-1869 [hydrothermal vent metagenome]|uniref:Uncharacterized protein n=1 Tax=hydrothermal vent metagenome TaxID=652676 RepID=A0A3B1CF38_9ZZZZ